MATEKQLRERWLTPEGKKVRQQVIDHISEDDWYKLLEGFLFTEELIDKRRDLRGIDLTKVSLPNANLMGVNLTDSKLIGALLVRANLVGSFLERADLKGANLVNANLMSTNLRGANFMQARLFGASLVTADLRGANLMNADLERADLRGANLREAKINNANLKNSNLSQADLSSADLTGAKVYGLSAWDIKIDKLTKAENLVINIEPPIKVSDIEVAQFMQMITDNKKISKIFTAMKDMSVLILGSFKRTEKKTLDFIKHIISKNEKNYVPIIFDFAPIKLQTLIDTINILSLLSRFIIIDLTRPAGQLLELAQFDKLQIPYAMIISKKAKHVPSNIEKYILSEWCYKKELITYSDKDKENELNKIINSIAKWAEEINEKYRKDLSNAKNKIKELNETLHKNKGKK